MLLAMSASLCFTSCGDDNDDSALSAEEYATAIVGTWTFDLPTNDWRVVVLFKADGTYIALDFYDDWADQTYPTLEQEGTGTWNISGSKLSIRSGANASTIVGNYDVKTISKTEMSLESSNGSYTARKTNDVKVYEYSGLVGTWRYHFGVKNYMQLRFQANGKGGEQEYDESGMLYSNPFDYTYNESRNTITIKMADGKTSTYTVFQLTGNLLEIKNANGYREKYKRVQ